MRETGLCKRPVDACNFLRVSAIRCGFLRQSATSKRCDFRYQSQISKNMCDLYVKIVRFLRLLVSPIQRDLISVAQISPFGGAIIPRPTKPNQTGVATLNKGISDIEPSLTAEKGDLPLEPTSLPSFTWTLRNKFKTLMTCNPDVVLPWGVPRLHSQSKNCKV